MHAVASPAPLYSKGGQHRPEYQQRGFWLTGVVDDDVVKVDHDVGEVPGDDDRRKCEANLAGSQALEYKEQEEDRAADAHDGTCMHAAHQQAENATSTKIAASIKKSDLPTSSAQSQGLLMQRSKIFLARSED